MRTFQFIAWLSLLAIAVFTLSPLGLRPRLPMDPDLERALAFGLAGYLFAFAYPKNLSLAVALVMIGVFGLEALQELRPDRHAHLHDALIKAAGASVGLGLGWLTAQLFRTAPALVASSGAAQTLRAKKDCDLTRRNRRKGPRISPANIPVRP
jgi:hypothetical protein